MGKTRAWEVVMENKWACIQPSQIGIAATVESQLSSSVFWDLHMLYHMGHRLRINYISFPVCE